MYLVFLDFYEVVFIVVGIFDGMVVVGCLFWVIILIDLIVFSGDIIKVLVVGKEVLLFWLYWDL